jgi:hypothetical protein
VGKEDNRERGHQLDQGKEYDVNKIEIGRRRNKIEILGEEILT